MTEFRENRFQNLENSHQSIKTPAKSWIQGGPRPRLTLFLNVSAESTLAHLVSPRWRDHPGWPRSPVAPAPDEVRKDALRVSCFSRASGR